ncbi:MAG: hypothetical protein JST92_14080, partial [Deltaproteobacteria bacterium]|nr:hypothetical protein [Deltaproteobacteria bacterium]
MSETRWEADDSDTRELWAVPGALAIALVFSFLPPVRFLFEASVCMELHELGHALASWLGGVFAIPLPMITLSFSSARSILVFLPLVLLFLWLRWALLKEDCD